MITPPAPVFALLPSPTIMIGLVGELRRRPIARPVVTPETVRAARAVWAEIRAAHGMRADGSARVLSAPDTNTKLTKSSRAVYGLNLSPATSSGTINTCVRYADCLDVCVLTAGRGSFSSVRAARAARTELVYRARDAFAVLVADEIRRAGEHAASNGYAWGVRLNVGSDVPWELVAPWLLEMISEHGGTAYDYTKAWGRTGSELYSITRSVDSRHGADEIRASIDAGVNVAVVLPIAKGAPVPTSYAGRPAIDGDLTDDRSSDPRGVVVILRAKGKLRGVPAGAHPLVKPLELV